MHAIKVMCKPGRFSVLLYKDRPAPSQSGFLPSSAPEDAALDLPLMAAQFQTWSHDQSPPLSALSEVKDDF